MCSEVLVSPPLHGTEPETAWAAHEKITVPRKRYGTASRAGIRMI